MQSSRLDDWKSRLPCCSVHCKITIRNETVTQVQDAVNSLFQRRFSDGKTKESCALMTQWHSTLAHNPQTWSFCWTYCEFNGASTEKNIFISLAIYTKTLLSQCSTLYGKKVIARSGIELMSSHPGSYPNSLMVRGCEPGGEYHDFDPRLGNYFFAI